MAFSTDVIFVGNIIHCDKPFNVRVLEKGFIAVRDGKIASIDCFEKLENYRKTAKNVSTIQLKNSQILIPGLIDTHIHAFQYPIIGIGMNVSLFSWLDEHIDKLEQKFRDLEYAKKVFDAIVKKLLSYGTTTACYNATTWTDATLVLVDSAIKYGQRALVGKVNVTVGMPGHLVETLEESIRDTKRLINEIAKRKTELVQPIITPGSALNVTTKDIPFFVELAKKYNLNIQAHMNETIDGIKQLESRPGDVHKNFTHTHEILTEKSLFAHCVHMTKEEIQKLADSGSAIAHCPDSNFNLLSGICDVRAFIEAGVKVGLGTGVF
uniref:Amidohydrolase-related domain-containing protein n=1 Tax=Photinus pyralis TaxID=7054 RepID=A0A1Y1LIW0_PHOPY